MLLVRGSDALWVSADGLKSSMFHERAQQLSCYPRSSNARVTQRDTCDHWACAGFAKGAFFAFLLWFHTCQIFLLYPFIISNSPLSAAPLLWLCAVTLQSAIQDPISRGRLSRSLPQYTGNPQFPKISKADPSFWNQPFCPVRVMVYVHSTFHPDLGSHDGLHYKYWPTSVSAFDRKQHAIELLLWLFMHCCPLKVWLCPPALLLIFIDAIYSLQHYTYPPPTAGCCAAPRRTESLSLEIPAISFWKSLWFPYCVLYQNECS